MSIQTIKRCFWRVPLISLIAGLLYTPCYVRIVIRFGVVEPGVIDDTVSLLTSAFLLVATLGLGWIILLRKQTRKEILVSSSIVVVYGILLFAVQFLSGSTTGPAAVVFMKLNIPLQWTIFPSSLSLFLQKQYGITIPFLGFVHFFVPWLFVILGRKIPTQFPEN